MKYQLALFDRSGESYRGYSEKYKLLEFDSLDEAEAKAHKVAINHPGCNVLVVTIHCGFFAEVRHLPPEPIVKMKRFTPGDQGVAIEVPA
jgi:hypothetical protein